MNIFGNIVKEAIEPIAIGSIATVLDKSLKILDIAAQKADTASAKKFSKYQAKMLSKNPSHMHLWMKESIQVSNGIIVYSEYSNYFFYDMDGNLKYFAKGGKSKKLQRIQLYNTKNYKIGEISENLFAPRKPLSFHKESHPTNFDVIIDKQKLGKIRTVASWGRHKLSVSFNGWEIRPKTIGTSQIKDSAGCTIAEITPKLFTLDMLSFLDFQNSDNEVLIVLLTLAIQAYIKSFDRKSAHDFLDYDEI